MFFLGHTLDDSGIIHNTDDKISAIKHHPRPESVKNVRFFIELRKYYRSFIDSFSKLTCPLTRLLKY